VIVLAIIHKPGSWSSRLTRWFTGSTAMHIGFVDLDRGKFYDMNLLFRRRCWPHYDLRRVVLYACPVLVTRETLEFYLDTDEDWYGVLDYLAFGIRKLWPGYRPSFKGAICSEKVDEILAFSGWLSPFTGTPSPADFEKVLIPLPLENNKND